jgi:hypothetical protein
MRSPIILQSLNRVLHKATDMHAQFAEGWCSPEYLSHAGKEAADMIASLKPG